MESNRQKKIAGVLQKDLVSVLQSAATQGGLQGTLISVTKVRVTSDLSQAKVFLSVFPTKEGATILEGVNKNKALIKHELAQLTRNQLRRMPELRFYLDDSLEYIDQIDRSLKGLDNPLTSPESLEKRKKK